MAKPIDFYFDFSSPYGYLAAQKIDELAARHRRGVDWHPILLGVVFKETGAQPLTQVPLKGEYSKRDIARSARFHAIDAFRMPSRFPIPTQAAARIVLAQKNTDPDLAKRVAGALYRAYFVDDRDISDPEIAADVAGEAGADRAAMRAAIDDAIVKEALKDENVRAIGAGVCGSPFFVVDGEPFWGLDRFPQLERWLEKNGF
ncbi:MAG TPA: 2-hydroxychromene-2-carboxylate isomerase [Casimicrobiaceae bacterium]|nr:2-hydroxychromene-2-carboxylate isomerase [Casimicrobiaceae bacterium]